MTELHSNCDSAGCVGGAASEAVAGVGANLADLPLLRQHPKLDL